VKGGSNYRGSVKKQVSLMLNELQLLLFLPLPRHNNYGGVNDLYGINL
jgi:hypothetical protein